MKDYRIERKLDELKTSNFRRRFTLGPKEVEYLNKNGMDKIKEHTVDFITKRLKPQFPNRDGSQTPMRGHPTFVAQHATATCCRGCLEKWHHIPRGHELTDEQVNYVVNTIMTWIENDMKGKK